MFSAVTAALVAVSLTLAGATMAGADQPQGKGVDNQATSGNGNSANAHANAHSNSGSTNSSSNSTATSHGTSYSDCGSNHNSTGTGANHTGGPYDANCQGLPSGNGNGNGQATGKPCAGCVGNADYKNPKGQMPNGSDHNNGYECDGNHGIGRTNPAHTGCSQGEVTPPAACPNGQPIPPSGKCETTTGEKCPNGQPIPPNGKCESDTPNCPEGKTMQSNGSCGGGNSNDSTTPSTPQQAVLGEQVGSTPREVAKQAPSGSQEVLGARAGGTTPSASSTSPASASAPAAAQRPVQASSKHGSLPFTGTDVVLVLLLGCATLLGGFALQRVLARD